MILFILFSRYTFLYEGHNNLIDDIYNMGYICNITLDFINLTLLNIYGLYSSKNKTTNDWLVG